MRGLADRPCQAAGAAQLQPPALHCGRPHPRCAVGGTRSAGQRRQRGGAARATAGGDGGAGDGTAQAAAPQDSSSGVKRPRITVLGGGVVGLSAATLIAEAYPGASVTVAADRFLHNTTSSGAAGLWEPYKLGAEQDAELISRWGGQTYGHFSRLHASPDAVAAGCIATTGYALWTGGANKTPVEDPTWRAVVPHFHRLLEAELAAYGQPYAGGWSYSTLICEGGRYLPWLTARFQRAGGRLAVAGFESRDDLAAALSAKGGWAQHRLDCDLLVNCTGLAGATRLFGDDSVYAIRGQVVRVRAPWIKSYYNIDGAYYVIPNIESVVLGGTSQSTYGDGEPDAADRQAILNNVCAHLPSLRGAEILHDWVGYRPGRPSIRLELVEEMFSSDGGKEARLPVVHNYGHGGAGVTLSWGCALDTLDLVRQALS